MKPTSPDIPLHDIKPLVEVPDYSLYMFIGVLLLALAVIAVVLYFVWKTIDERNRVNERKLGFEALKEIDFGDAKSAAYAISRHGRLFAEDSPRHTQIFASLSERLEAYKYKKEVGEIDDEALGYYRNYLEMIDV